MITKEQAEQIKELSLDVAFAMERYSNMPQAALKEKKEAWDVVRAAEKAFDKFVASLVKE